MKELNFEHEDNSKVVESGCLAPEWCGLSCDDDWQTVDFCDNCQEDVDHMIQCRMDLFYQGRS